MSLIPQKTITVRREAIGTLDGGVKVDGDISEFEIHGSLQPPSSRDLKNLPEGTHYTVIYKIYSKDYVAEDGQHETDKFFIDGGWCKTFVYNNWNNNIINHKMIMVGR